MVRRTIADWTQDEQGDWVAHLSCLHRQHVRHAPPFRDRPWVLDAEGRGEHLGADAVGLDGLDIRGFGYVAFDASDHSALSGHTRCTVVVRGVPTRAMAKPPGGHCL